MDGGSTSRQSYFGPMPGAARETKVWQEAIGLAGDVIRVVRRSTRRETKAFTDAIRENRPAPIPAQEVVWTNVIMDGIYRSAAEGREVAVSLPE